MSSKKALNISWGNTVQIKSSAPNQYNPGEIGSVCGLRTIDSIEVAQKFQQDLGSIIYLIEFSNGKTLEIPENFIIKI